MDDPLTREMIEQSRTIAKGRKIRDVSRLVREHGGTASKWTKKSSPPFRRDDEICEYHWYEHHGIGRVEVKLKVIGSA
jgi:hypothetical protein